MSHFAKLSRLVLRNVPSPSFINGLPGFVTIEQDGAHTTALEIEDDKIVAIYVVRNPDKLRRFDGQSVH